MFVGSEFNQDISNWKINENCDMKFMFDDCPLQNNLPQWYKE